MRPKRKKNKPGQLNVRSDVPNVPQTEHRCDLVTRAYQIRAETIDDKTRSVEAVLSTEAMVEVFDWSRWEIITEILLMSGCRLPANGQVPLQDSHDRTTVQKQLGSCRELRIEGDKLIGRNVFSSSAMAEHPWTLVREGHLTDNSIGYKINNPVIIEAGKTVVVEGRQFTAPANRNLRIVTDWQLKENSVCSVGADSTAKNRNENRVTNRKDSQMNEFQKWLQARGLTEDGMADETRTALEADFKAEQERAAKEKQEADAKAKADADAKRTADDLADKKTEDDSQRSATDIANEAVRVERERVSAIRELAGEDCPDDVIERAITEGQTIEQTRSAVLEAVRKQRPNVSAPAGIVRNDQMSRQVVEDSMLMRAGYDEIVTEDKNEGTKRAEIADKYRDMCLLDVCRHAIMLDGGAVPPSREDTIRAAFSTSTLPIILGAVVNKSLMRGYSDIPESWRKWCNVGQAPDFKTITRARLTDTGDLQEVGSGGEVKYGGAEEEYEQYNIASYAKNWAVTRVQIINDDLSALTRMPRKMGVKANQKVCDLPYTHLLANGTMQDGVALFHATHSNLNTTATLAAATLRTAVQNFYKQTDKDGKPIGVAPRILLVPPDLMLFAMELIKSPAIVIAGAGDSVRGNRNVLADLMIEVVSDPRMSNSSYTGYSTSTWYMTADPKVAETLEVAFLNGKQAPTLERFNLGPDRMGIVFRTFIDVGCKSLDSRTMAKNTA